MKGDLQSFKLTHTGRFVGEPNADWQINSFNSHSIGKLEIPAAGYYDIELEIQAPTNQVVDFQWVWLKSE